MPTQEQEAYQAAYDDGYNNANADRHRHDNEKRRAFLTGQQAKAKESAKAAGEADYPQNNAGDYIANAEQLAAYYQGRVAARNAYADGADKREAKLNERITRLQQDLDKVIRTVRADHAQVAAYRAHATDLQQLVQAHYPNDGVLDTAVAEGLKL